VESSNWPDVPRGACDSPFCGECEDRRTPFRQPTRLKCARPRAPAVKRAILLQHRRKHNGAQSPSAPPSNKVISHPICGIKRQTETCTLGAKKHEGNPLHRMTTSTRRTLKNPRSKIIATGVTARRSTRKAAEIKSPEPSYIRARQNTNHSQALRRLQPSVSPAARPPPCRCRKIDGKGMSKRHEQHHGRVPAEATSPAKNVRILPFRSIAAIESRISILKSVRTAAEDRV